MNKIAKSLAILLACVTTFGVAEAEDFGIGGGNESTPIVVGGQSGWMHDESDASGYFNTFDSLALLGDKLPPRKVHVFLPRDYATSGRRYPVVYFNDGNQVFFSHPGQDSWYLAKQLTELYKRGSIPKIIAVGIDTPDREREYTHEPVPSRPNCCDLGKYIDYVALQLKPFIDKNYRTLSGSSSTGIVGSSHGGLAAFAIAAHHPEVFGFAGCLSSSVWVGMAPFGSGINLEHSALVTKIAAPLRHTKVVRGDLPKIWLDWGLIRTGGDHNSLIEKNAQSRGEELAKILDRDFGYTNGVDLRTYADPQGEHSEPSWRRRILTVLPWLLK